MPFEKDAVQQATVPEKEESKYQRQKKKKGEKSTNRKVNVRA